MLAPLLGLGKQQGAAWAGMGMLDPSADVLAMFQAPLPPLPTGSGGSRSSGGGAGQRAAAAAALPLPPLPFALPPLPDAGAGVLGGLPLPAFDAAAAAAAAFMLNPAAAAAAATFAAAATMAEAQQQQLEESMADAVSCPAGLQAAGTAAAGGAAAAAAGPAAATPGGQFKAAASALTSHLSDMAGPDAEMHGKEAAGEATSQRQPVPAAPPKAAMPSCPPLSPPRLASLASPTPCPADTATSPAPHMAIAQLAARRNLAAAMAPTLTGGAPAAALKGRPPLPNG